jgi:Fic family protein
MIFQAPELDTRSREVLGLIDALKKRLGSMLSEPRRWDGLFRRTAFARAIRGSNTIEGYNVTVDDAIAAVEGEPPLEADEKTWAEILGYRQAMTYVLQLARDPHFGYSGDTVRSLHYMMLSHDLSKGPGQWRPGYIYVRNDERNEIVYEGPDAGAIPALMAELVDSLNVENDQDLIVRGAMAHLNLVMIHPFRDGNGRMARALQTLVLARGGHFSPVFSSIEEYLGRNTLAYYSVLAEVGQGRWQPAQDATAWVKFCLTAHFRQATTVLNRTERMRRIWDALEAEVTQHGLPERTKLALADAATGHRVRNPTYRKLADISDGLASRDLRLLVEAGLLEPHGEKRGRYYVGSATIMEIRKRSEGARGPIADPFADPFAG